MLMTEELCAVSGGISNLLAEGTSVRRSMANASSVRV
jgi:hypothetical protein